MLGQDFPLLGQVGPHLRVDLRQGDELAREDVLVGGSPLLGLGPQQFVGDDQAFVRLDEASLEVAEIGRASCRERV